MKRIAVHLLAALAICTLPITVAAAPPKYGKAGEIAIGGEGGWDMVLADGATHRLYVSHSTKVIVADTDKLATIGEIDDTPGVHGIAIAPDMGKLYVSNGRENTVSVVDAKTLKTHKKLPTGASPDAIIYEPKHHEIYCFNGHGNSATIIDANKDEVASTITLEGNPEFACEDIDAGKVYVNLEDKSAVAVISAASHQVENTWPVAPGEEPSGIAIDPKNHHLFMGCGNNLMVMVDSQNGKVLSNVPVGKGIDGAECDSQLQLAFCPSGADGTMTIAHVEGDKLTTVQELKTTTGCRTMTAEPKSHRIYVPAAQFEPAAAAAPGAPRQRPKVIPGSFKVLVYEPVKQ